MVLLEKEKQLLYIDADTLKLTYSIYGAFYDIKLEGEENIQCRNVLDIIADKRGGVPLPGRRIPALYDCTPEAYFCMMNPGSSEPQPTAEENYQGPPEYDLDETLPSWILQTPMVSAKPDTTQYMVMNVMEYVGFNHVRVINLSDIRESKSGKFVDKIESFYGAHEHHVHSLFDPLRKEELKLALGDEKKVPVVAAWGKNRKYINLIHLCKAGIAGTPCYGLFGDRKKLLAKHPLPPDWNKQMVWLADMVDLLKNELYKNAFF